MNVTEHARAFGIGIEAERRGWLDTWPRFIGTMLALAFSILVLAVVFGAAAHDLAKAFMFGWRLV